MFAGLVLADHNIGDVSAYPHSIPDEKHHSPYEIWAKNKTASFDDDDVAAYIEGFEPHQVVLPERVCENGAMAGMVRAMHRLTTGRPDGVAHPSGRAAGQIVAVLLWALTMSQALVVVHGYTHPTTQATARCGVCLIGARVAHVPDPPPEPLEARALCVQLAAVARAPYVLPVQRTNGARAPPLLPSTSAVA